MNIEVKNLNKKFDTFELKNISIKVPKGKIIGLIGENGAGKTTLIKCLLNVMPYEYGEVLMFKEPFKDEMKQDIGVVFDNAFINETYPVRDVNTIMKRIYKNWDSKLFFKYMKDYKIPLKKEIRKLSTGMKKKVEIATALCHKPKILILDEPTSGLDPVIRSEILDMFEEFVNETNNSILLSTHITSDLEHIADDVIFISNGEIIFDKPLKKIKEEYIILELTKEEFNEFNKKDIVRYKKNRLDYQVLITKNNMKDEYKKYIKNITTLDDIMLLYIRGVVCGD